MKETEIRCKTKGNKSKEEEDIIIEREKVGQVFCVLKIQKLVLQVSNPTKNGRH